MKISIDDQVAAMQDTVSNHRSYIRLVRRLVAEDKRPKEILEDTEARLPAMEAALRTLEWIQKNRQIIVEVYEKQKTPPLISAQDAAKAVAEKRGG